MRRILLLAAAAVAGCTSQPRVVPVVSAPPSAPAAAAPSGYGNLVVPARLADGSYVTPNRGVSTAAVVWHLRAGLNVAALACRGPVEAELVAGYNALLHRHRADFDRAYRALGSEHGSAAAFDGAMTRLYNYYALPPAQPGLCAAAQAVLADAATVPTGGLEAFAPNALARIERPYTQVFAAQEAWLAGRMAPATTQVAAVAAPAVTPVAANTSVAATPRVAIDARVAGSEPMTVAGSAPRIAVDRAIFRIP